MNNCRESFWILLYFLLLKYKITNAWAVSKHVITKKNIQTIFAFSWVFVLDSGLQKILLYIYVNHFCVTSRYMLSSQPNFTQCSWGLHFLEKMTLKYVSFLLAKKKKKKNHPQKNKKRTKKNHNKTKQNPKNNPEISICNSHMEILLFKTFSTISTFNRRLSKEAWQCEDSSFLSPSWTYHTVRSMR